MSTEQTDYAGRLPYGLWVGLDAGEEHLFDRGYNAIATRPLAAPWRVTIHQKRRFLDAGPGRLVAYFYGDGHPSPWYTAEALARCERIFARFCLGRDVRFGLEENKGKKYCPGC